MRGLGPERIGGAPAMLLNTSPRPTIAPPKMDALPPPVPRRAAHELLRDPDAADWELWRRAEQQAWDDRRFLPGRIEIREYRRNRSERFCASVRGTLLVLAGTDGMPDIHFTELRENGLDRLLMEAERRCNDWRETLRLWVLADRPLFGWRNGPVLRLGSSMIGGMVCRSFVVPAPSGDSGCEYTVWIDEGTGHVRRMGFRRTGNPWKDKEWYRIEREVALDCGPDPQGRWIPLTQHERVSYRQRFLGGGLIGCVDRFSSFGDHWEQAEALPSAQP
jgi:hypothetical protein